METARVSGRLGSLWGSAESDCLIAVTKRGLRRGTFRVPVILIILLC